jgi:hypothetical protein
MTDHEREATDNAGQSDSTESVTFTIRPTRVVSPWSESVTATTLPDETTVGTDESTVTYALKITRLEPPFMHFRLSDEAGKVILEGVGDSEADATIAIGFRLEDGPDTDMPNN